MDGLESNFYRRWDVHILVQSLQYCVFHNSATDKLQTTILTLNFIANYVLCILCSDYIGGRISAQLRIIGCLLYFQSFVNQILQK